MNLCGGSVKEDRSGVVGEHHFGGDSSFVLGELHTVNRLRRAAEGQHCVVQLQTDRDEDITNRKRRYHWTVKSDM